MTQANDTHDDILPVSDIDTFAGLILAWHEERIARLQHLQEIPTGVTMSVVSNEKPDEMVDLELTGDAHQAFVAGVTLSLHFFAKLPFTAMDASA